MAKKNKKRLIVVSKHGRHRFQRGLVTASFLGRNLNIEDAMTLSAELKRRLEGRDEVTTKEIRALVKELAPMEQTGEFRAIVDQQVPLLKTRRGLVPFSKGVLLRSLTTRQAFA